MLKLINYSISCSPFPLILFLVFWDQSHSDQVQIKLNKDLGGSLGSIPFYQYYSYHTRMLCSFIFFSFWTLAIISACLLCCIEFDMQVTEVSQIWFSPKKSEFSKDPIATVLIFPAPYGTGIFSGSWGNRKILGEAAWSYKHHMKTELSHHSDQRVSTITTNKCTPDHSWGTAEIDKSFKNQNMLSIHRAFFKEEWKWGTVSDKAFPLNNTILTFNL